MKKGILILLAVFLLALAGCSSAEKKSDSIVVLFTNDVHGGIDDDIGYAGLAAYKQEMSEQYQYVTLVDCGDHTQGSYACALSKGESIIEIMNEVGYDFAIFGNHEFDFGMEQLKANVEKANAQYLNCNVSYKGSGEDPLKASKPYEIVTYGKTRVAYIGVTTPFSLSDTAPIRFMENEKVVYDFAAGENGQKLYDIVQKNVDECREKGADFVVLLTHMGTAAETDRPYTSLDIIENTNGVDVVLDGHSHTEASCWIRQNKDGEDVLLSSTGEKLNNIGRLVLMQDGTAMVGYIEEYDQRDETIAAKVDEINQELEDQMNQVMTHTDTALSCSDAAGVRMIRSREMPIGDLVADAYRILAQADIGMCNGGGIRADLPAGDVTYGDIIAVNPYGNSLTSVKVTGAELLDMLEYFYRNVQAEYVLDGKAYGEEGSFMQISGMKLTVNTSVESSVETDETDEMTGIGGTRRVSDVMILEGEDYVPLDPEKTYTLASNDYMIKNGGSGMLYMLKDHELVLDQSISDYQALVDYINSLDGNLSDYQKPAGRITIK